jgi:hypothetical protein
LFAQGQHRRHEGRITARRHYSTRIGGMVRSRQRGLICRNYAATQPVLV